MVISSATVTFPAFPLCNANQITILKKLEKQTVICNMWPLGINAEYTEKSQYNDINKDTTKESTSMACSNVSLWKLDTQKEWRNTSWRLWDERTEKYSAGFMDSEENKWVGS